MGKSHAALKLVPLWHSNMNPNFLVIAFGILGNVISFMVLLAPLPTFYEIYKRKSTEGFQSIPYIVSLFSAMLWIYYAFLKPNLVLLITINSIAIAAHTFYISLFIYYATKQARVYTVMLVVLDLSGMGVIILLTYFLRKGKAREAIVGWICLVFSLCVFIAPLAIIRRVVRTKSVEYMPFYLSFFLTISAVAWFLYGLLHKDYNIALPNIIGFAFGIMQMGLYAIYKDSNVGAAAATETIDDDDEITKEDRMTVPLAPFPVTDAVYGGSLHARFRDLLKLSPLGPAPTPANTFGSSPWSTSPTTPTPAPAPQFEITVSELN